MSEEIWKPIPNHPLYEVSNIGNVRTKRPRNRNCKGGVYRDIKFGLASRKKYKFFTAYHNGERYKVTVHTAVLEAFVGPRPKGLFCCHNDGDSFNNRVENLRWGTAKENMQDQIKHGVHISINMRGEKVHLSKMTDKKVLKLRQELENGLSLRKASNKYGIAVSTVVAIKLRRTWTHL